MNKVLRYQVLFRKNFFMRACVHSIIAGRENNAKESFVVLSFSSVRRVKGNRATIRMSRGYTAGICGRIQRSGRIQDRNGPEFVMSGVEMTVPFVLKFVGFSSQGIVT